MRYLLILLMTILSFSCKPAEERIKAYSYTKEWYFKDGQRYQLYKTKYDKKYILVINKKETKIIRKYVK
jgi:hypothetical protein